MVSGLNDVRPRTRPTGKGVGTESAAAGGSTGRPYRKPPRYIRVNWQ